jgi:hypothetical protein
MKKNKSWEKKLQTAKNGKRKFKIMFFNHAQDIFKKVEDES